jgi:hypothetical protein
MAKVQIKTLLPKMDVYNSGQPFQISEKEKATIFFVSILGDIYICPEEMTIEVEVSLRSPVKASTRP